jgi:hypothetical protein
MADYWDLDAWRRAGLRDEDIFDPKTGKLKPGWSRTGRGYENANWPGGPVNPFGPTVPDTTPFGPPGGGLDSFSGGDPSYTAPDWLSIGDFDPGPAFSYKDFVAPDPKQIANDPAYQWRLSQGLKALSAQKAGQGTFLSGATGKALQDYGQNSASQEYGNIWNRSLSEYGTNRDNAFGSWASQYGQRKDAYSFRAADTQAHNQFNLSNANMNWKALFDKWKATGDWASSIFSAGAD